MWPTSDSSCLLLTRRDVNRSISVMIFFQGGQVSEASQKSLFVVYWKHKNVKYPMTRRTIVICPENLFGES